jgi:cytochrome c oxidase cbb3-type subunit 3
MVLKIYHIKGEQMAKETNQVFDHDFDGIKEYDNPLPPWWVMLFYFTIIWGIGYYLYYHLLDMGNLPEAEYRIEMAAAEDQVQKQAESQAAAPEQGAATAMLEGDEALAAGKAVFDKPGQCVSCHKSKGEGLIGPNLTDNFWINGDGSLEAIIKVVTEGVPAKGMITWSKILKPEEIKYVSLYVQSLHGTNPPNPKAPEGKEY